MSGQALSAILRHASEAVPVLRPRRCDPLQPFFDDNPMGIYEKILAAKIAFPPHIDSLTKDLIRRLLTVDRSKRLGNLRGGAMDVMMHPWFSGVDWGALERRQIRAPIIPPVADAGQS